MLVRKRFLSTKWTSYFEKVDKLKGPPPLQKASMPPPPTPMPIPGVKHAIAVSSAKGGVGKSTSAVNLALSISRLGNRVGILDADIFGPSIPRLMMMRNHKPDLSPSGAFVPLENYGVKCMSMGFLVAESDPVVWRGLMVMKALQQLIYKVNWGELDYLIIDMPPGTGN